MRDRTNTEGRRTLLLRRLVLALAALAALLCATRADAQTPRSRAFTFEYATTVRDLPAGAHRVELWIPVPHDDDYQQITNFEVISPYPYRIEQARYGNRILHLKITDPRQSSFNVLMRFDAVRREHVNAPLRDGTAERAASSAAREPADPEMRRWLEPDRLVPLDAQIRRWAQEVVAAAGARTDLEKARAIYNHVVSTVKYDKTGQGWGRGDIYYACDARRGNCTDFHAIFIGYARAVGIPARFAIGFPLPSERGEGQVSGYHCWAEAYIKGIGWVPVDASEAAKDPARRDYFFGAHDENRVEFTRGRDLMLEPRQQGEPLNYFIYPYAEVDGKAHAAVDKSFKYHDRATVAASTTSRRSRLKTSN